MSIEDGTVIRPVSIPAINLILELPNAVFLNITPGLLNQ